MSLRRMAAAVLSGLVVVATACAAQPSRELSTDRVVIAAGNPGGVYEVYASSISAALGANFDGVHGKTMLTDGSVENVQLVASGRADLGFSLADTVQLAATGRRPFTSDQDLVAVARLYDNFLHVIVRADSPITRLGDLGGGVVNIGSPGSGTAVTALNLVHAAGLHRGRDLQVSTMDLRAGLAALGRGEVAAVVWSGGLPTSAVNDADVKFGIRLLDLGPAAERLAAQDPHVYTVASIPASTYTQPEATTTVSVPNLLVAQAKVDPDLCYQVVRAMFEHADSMAESHPEARRLNLNAAIDTYPLDLCHGSIDYLREVKE